eukprot:g9661.t1
MVKTRQSWVLLSPLDLLALEAVGGVASASAVGRVASVSAVAVRVVATSVSVATAAMVFAVPEVGNPAVADVTSSVGSPIVAS